MGNTKTVAITWYDTNDGQPYLNLAKVPVSMSNDQIMTRITKRLRNEGFDEMARFIKESGEIWNVEAQPDFDLTIKSKPQTLTILTNETNIDWSEGYTEHNINRDLGELNRQLGQANLDGHLYVLWDLIDEFGFGGNSSLYYIRNDENGEWAYEVTMPFIQGPSADTAQLVRDINDAGLSWKKRKAKSSKWQLLSKNLSQMGWNMAYQTVC